MNDLQDQLTKDETIVAQRQRIEELERVSGLLFGALQERDNSKDAEIALSAYHQLQRPHPSPSPGGEGWDEGERRLAPAQNPSRP